MSIKTYAALKIFVLKLLLIKQKKNFVNFLQSQNRYKEPTILIYLSSHSLRIIVFFSISRNVSSLKENLKKICLPNIKNVYYIFYWLQK